MEFPMQFQYGDFGETSFQDPSFHAHLVSRGGPAGREGEEWEDQLQCEGHVVARHCHGVWSKERSIPDNYPL